MTTAHIAISRDGEAGARQERGRDVVTLGRDGIGKCLCGLSDYGRPATGDRAEPCWACRAREGPYERITVHRPSPEGGREYESRTCERHKTGDVFGLRVVEVCYFVGTRDEGNAYNHLAENDEGCTYTGRECAGAEDFVWSGRAGYYVGGEASYDVGFVDDEMRPLAVDGIKGRPTLNPTARDLWHLRTGEVWGGKRWWVRAHEDDWPNEWLSDDGLVCGQNDEPIHEWGDESLRALAEETE